MNLLNKLERKLGRFALPNLMFLIIAIQFVVYVANILFPDAYLNFRLMLNRDAILSGQIWRLITFMFIPPNSSVLFIIFSLYFYYLIGTTLESAWGSFKFNVYYFTGAIGTIIASFISGSATNIFLNYSLFFAYAMLYPNNEVYMFFLIPIKIKILALIDALFFLYMFFTNPLDVKLSIIASLLNFFLFFGKDFISYVKDQIYYFKRRHNFNNFMGRR